MKKHLPPIKARQEQKCPTGHLRHKTQADAQCALDAHVQDAKRNGLEGKSWKRLNVYRCHVCGSCHVGHAKQSWPENKTAEPQQEKPLTEAQARRKAGRERKEADRHAQRAKMFEDYAENLRWANAMLDRELALTAAATQRSRK
jgi:hypothetical protein